jgi:predicted tellurium resistance membrane protein TerC
MLQRPDLGAGGSSRSPPRLAALPGFDPAAAAWRASLEFLTGYLVEKSLAVDNVFVFVVVFSFFAIPARYHHRVLFYGILGALVFRAIFIALGSALMQYHAVIIDRLSYIDHACLDLIANWRKQHMAREGQVELPWDDLQRRYHERNAAVLKDPARTEFAPPKVMTAGGRG